MATLTISNGTVTLVDGADSWSGQVTAGRASEGCFLFRDDTSERLHYVRVPTSSATQPWTVNDYVLNVDLLWMHEYSPQWVVDEPVIDFEAQEAMWRRWIEEPEDQVRIDATTLRLWLTSDTTAVVCGQELLKTAEGVSLSTKTISGSGTTWEYGYASVNVPAGTWEVKLRVTCGSGAGPTNTIDIKVERVDVGCAVQQTILSSTGITLTKGATATVTATATPGAVTFGLSDRILLTVTDSAGNQTKTARYESSSPDDSRLILPL